MIDLLLKIDIGISVQIVSMFIQCWYIYQCAINIIVVVVVLVGFCLSCKIKIQSFGGEIGVTFSGYWAG